MSRYLLGRAFFRRSWAWAQDKPTKSGARTTSSTAASKGPRRTQRGLVCTAALTASPQRCQRATRLARTRASSTREASRCRCVALSSGTVNPNRWASTHTKLNSSFESEASIGALTTSQGRCRSPGRGAPMAMGRSLGSAMRRMPPGPPVTSLPKSAATGSSTRSRGASASQCRAIKCSRRRSSLTMRYHPAKGTALRFKSPWRVRSSTQRSSHWPCASRSSKPSVRFSNTGWLGTRLGSDCGSQMR